MSFIISGLAADEFQPLFNQSDDALRAQGIIRKKADSKPGYPCRITLEDAEPGETVLLLNHQSLKTDSPFRSSYAIYVRENAQTAQTFTNALPPVFKGRPIALRLFDTDGMLIGADMGKDGSLIEKIEAAFTDPAVAYIHAHNAMHGCFAAEVKRSE
ncbi:MAG: hypothetical protein DHS20C05_04520 [Hyphococcus sp.]|nr:MAG: hypothetical protein DHS20C05_04520 [Marinicaulis sp.]